MSKKDIPDEATTKKFQKIIADATTDHIVDANKMVETPKRSLVADAIERQGMTPNPNNCEVTAISGRRFESDIDEAKPETPEEQAAKNKPAVDLLTEWIKRTPTPEEEEAWAAFAKLVEESEPDETPEEAAETYYERDANKDGFSIPRAFMAGVRWAEERGRK
jgi:hypothetical protein